MAVRYRLAWILLSFLYLALRFQNLPGTVTEHGIALNGTDPYYRLHRIEKIVQGDSAYPLHDPNLSFPRGFDVPWPLGLDELIAIPLRLANVRDLRTIQIFSALSIPALSLPTLWATGAVASSLAGPYAGLAAGFVLALSPGHIRASKVGEIHHHFLEAMFTIAALFFLERLRRKLSSSARWALLALLAFGPSFWPQAWVVALFLAASFLIDRAPGFQNRCAYASWLFFASSLLSLLPLSLSDRFTSGSIWIFGFSWWTPALYAFLALPFSLMAHFRLRPFRLDKRILIYVGYAASIALFLFWRHGPSIVSVPTSGAMAALDTTRGSLSVTSEATSPLQIPWKSWDSMGFYPLLLAFVWFTLQAFRRERWWFVGYASGALILSLFQLRFIYLASPILTIAAISLLHDLFYLFAIRRSLAVGAVWAMAFCIASPGQVVWGWTHTGNVHPFYRAYETVTQFMESEFRRHPRPPTENAVASHWDYGHWFVHDLNVPVVAHPFQDTTLMDTFALFCARDTRAIDDFVKSYPVRYLLLEAPTGRLERWLRLLGRDISVYFELRRSPDGKVTLDARDSFFELLAVRFFLYGGEALNGDFPVHWRLVFITPYASPDRSDLPALKLFERVPGAHVRARLRAKRAFLTAHIETSDRPIEFRQAAVPDSEGTVQWTVPYGVTSLGGIRFDGHYTVEIEGEESKPKLLRILVREEDVLQGHLIDAGSLD
ncbi:MAG TPA: hypothetical protein VI895_02455 [Bdellovibrionota bacterium]|nr:hypothetical protein [Bdellovibrionota bacterium]